MLGGILLLAFFLSSPADDTSATTDFDITVQPVLEISVSPSLHLTFETDNVLHSGSVDVSVLSNSRNGFTATVSTIYDSSDVLSTSLTNNIDNNLRINTLDNSNVIAADFPTNRWGYSIDGGATFNAMPGSDEPATILNTTSAISDGNKSIYIGAKVDTDTPSGTYENTLLITVVPKYVPISLKESFALAGKHRTTAVDGHNYYAMQDMTPAICDRADELEDQTQVVDVRDKKIYWIAKLRDDNCWMTQNLDFDIMTDNVVPETSNVDVAWNSSSEYPPQVTSTTIFNNNDDTGTYSYDPGDYYTPDPYGIDHDEEINCTTANGGENCHYHLGNLYQYNAATAGEGASDDGWYYNEDYGTEMKEVEHSICPKGWRLPSYSYENNDYSINKLLFAYNIINSGTDADALFRAPLYFNVSGVLHSGSYELNDGILYSEYWTSTAAIDGGKHGYVLELGYYNYGNRAYFDILEDSGYAENAASVRCVAKGDIKHTVTFSIYGNHPEYGTISTSSITVMDGASINVDYHGKISADITVGNKTVTAIGGVDFRYTYGVDTVLYSSCGNNVSSDCNIEIVFSPRQAHTNMQQMTHSLCESIPVGTEGQLVDSRDNKPYWVAKLADGNCWMTQNLDFDITTNNVVPETSNVDAAWNSSSEYPPQATTTTIFNNTSKTGTYSYDPGNYYLAGGAGAKQAINCSAVNGNTNCHYHLGNLYQYNAATAGEGGSDEGYYEYINYKKVEHSICPKGWILPSSGSYGYDDHDFMGLLSTYGLSWQGDDRDLYVPPFYFVNSGKISSGRLMYVGSYSAYWTSLAVKDEGVYKEADNLHIDDHEGFILGWDESGAADIEEGVSVRCVAL